MVDNTVWGKLAWLRASGSPGKRAWLRCVVEYVMTGRLPMLFSVVGPLVAFPIMGLIFQALPVDPGFMKEYGLAGVLVAWLMLAQLREEKRRDRVDRERSKRDQEFIAAIHKLVEGIKERPCLYQLEYESDAANRSKHSG